MLAGCGHRVGGSPSSIRRPAVRACLGSCGPCVTRSGTDVAAYLDTSALVKPVVVGEEPAALIAWNDAADREMVSSDLARNELLRAGRRAAPDRVVRARDVLVAAQNGRGPA